MGTTLTGTTPQDTYDSLIKVTDNGPLTGSLKTLTDGLGNDSALALSTGAASVTGTLNVTGALTIGSAGVVNGIINSADGMYLNVDSDASGSTPEFQFAKGRSTTSGGTALMTITNAGNVGIGTSSPSAQLEVSVAASVGGVLRLNNARTALFDGDINGQVEFSNNEASGGASGVRSSIVSLIRDVAGRSDMVFTTASSNGAATEKIRILADGGLTFNGDTAAANALDDYEEGEWTPVFTDTLGNNATHTSVGRYTKIGRQVTLSCTTTWSNKSAAAAGSLVYMSGVPFNMNNKANGIVTYYDDMNLTTVGAFTIANAGTTLCYFPIQDNAVEASFLTFGETTNTTAFWFSFTYFV